MINMFMNSKVKYAQMVVNDEYDKNEQFQFLFKLT